MHMYKIIVMIDIYNVADYESTIKARLKCIYKECEQSTPEFIYTRYPERSHKFDRSPLPFEIPYPICLSDSTHYTTFFTANIFSKYGGSKKFNLHGVSKVEDIKIKNYWRYISKHNRGDRLDGFIKAMCAINGNYPLSITTK